MQKWPKQLSMLLWVKWVCKETKREKWKVKGIKTSPLIICRNGCSQTKRRKSDVDRWHAGWFAVAQEMRTWETCCFSLDMCHTIPHHHARWPPSYPILAVGYTIRYRSRWLGLSTPHYKSGVSLLIVLFLCVPCEENSSPYLFGHFWPASTEVLCVFICPTM